MNAPPWPNHEWEPLLGCSQVSAGCRRCRAQVSFKEFGDIQHFPEKLAEPDAWPTSPPRSVAVAFNSDLFHEDASPVFTRSVLAAIQRNPAHIFWVLTKRPHRFAEFEQDFPDGIPNLYLGVSCEDQAALDLRLPILLATTLTPKKVLAAKPLLGFLDLGAALEYDGRQLSLVSLGPERDPNTGATIRTAEDDCYIDDLVRQCFGLNIPTRAC